MKKLGYVVAQDKGVTVALDTNLTEDLIREGYAREIISKLQTMRKEAGLEVTDRIHVYAETADETLASVIEESKDALCKGVLAVSVVTGIPEGAYRKDWSINGIDAALGLAKA